jgi:uncharacterized membrane protein YgcG
MAAALNTIKNWHNSIYFKHDDYFGSQPSITIKQFLQLLVTSNNESNDCWLHDDQINIPLILLADVVVKRPDVIVIQAGEANALCSIGLRVTTTEDFESLCPQYYSALLSDDIRWIVVPCSDGMYNISMSKPGALTTTNGCHWGLLVVDRKRNDARWLDGHLTLGRKHHRSNKLSIKHMFHAGTAAGKILCGLEQVMGREPGSFTARTLKYVPHDKANNTYQEDPGPCGPYLFALLRYLFAYPEYLENLEDTFKRSEWDQHCIDMNFDSLSARLDMQDIIREEVAKTESVDDLPYNLTARILRLLDKPMATDPPAGLSALLAGRTPAPRAIPPRGGRLPSRQYWDTMGQDGNSGGGGFGGSGGGGPGGSGGGGPGSSGGPSGNKKNNQHPGSRKKKPGPGTQPPIGQAPGTTIPGGTEHGGDIVNTGAISEDEATKRDAKTLEDRLPRGMHTRNFTLSYPAGFTKADVPNLMKTTGPENDMWYNLYAETLFKQKRGLGLHTATIRAVLHRTYKGTFSTLPPNSVAGLNNLDSHAFSYAESKESWTVPEIVARLDDTYLTLEIPLFAALTNEQVDHWMQRLVPGIETLFLDNHGDFSYNQARGMLYRMFVGDFADMSYGDLRLWLEADPSFANQEKTNVERCRHLLEIMYRVSDEREIPYLRESPLHWPAREHRVKRGHKRKRTGEDGGGDDGDGIDGGEPTTNNKRAKAGSKPTEQPSETLTPDFLNMAEGEIETWLEMLPTALKVYVRDDKTGVWIVDQRARIWLSRIYTRTFQDLQASEDLSEEQLGVLRAWRSIFTVAAESWYPPKLPVDMRRFLNNRLMSSKVITYTEVAGGSPEHSKTLIVTFPDWSADRSKWPAAWRTVTTESTDALNTSNAKKTQNSNVGLDFETMEEDHLRIWLETLPSELRPVWEDGVTGEWIISTRSRRWLTDIYGPIFQHIQDSRPLDKANFDLLENWRATFPDAIRRKYGSAGNTSGMSDFLAKTLVSNDVPMPKVDVQTAKTDEVRISNSDPEAAKSGTSTVVIINGTTYTIPNDDRTVFRPHVSSSTEFPKGTTHLPSFAHMNMGHRQTWMRCNQDIDAHRQSHRSRHTAMTSSAMLHKKFKHTFLSEPDADFRKLWITDRMVFDSAEEFDASKIRYAMMAFYEPETLKRIEKYATKKRPAEDAEAGGVQKKAKVDSQSSMSEEDLENLLAQGYGSS